MSEKGENQTIPPYLEEAHLLFCQELSSHIALFQGVIQRVLDRRILSEEARQAEQLAIKGRAHLIKGGAGFFGLHSLAELGRELEKTFSRELTVDEYELLVARLLNSGTEELCGYLSPSSGNDNKA